MKTLVRFLHLSDAPDKRGYFLGSPHGSTGAELDWFGKTASTASLPPCAFADGDDGKDLGQAKKAESGDGQLFL